MGALRGAIACRKFYVRGDAPETQRILERIRARRFRPLVPEDEGDSVGWAPIEHPLDDEISLRAEAIVFGEHIMLAIRTDRWKFPAALVKARQLSAERAYRAKVGKERISRAEKAEIREAVERRLRRELPPVTSIVDLDYQPLAGIVRIFSTSASALSIAEELFEKTTGLRLLPEGPYVLGVQLTPAQDTAARLRDLAPTGIR